MAARVLVVDDEPEIRSLIDTVLSGQGCRCDLAANGDEAIAFLQSHRYDLVLSDARMPGSDGLEVLRWLRANDPDLPLIMITGHATVEHAIEAMKLGAYDYIEKPFDIRELSTLVRNAIQTTSLKRQNSRLRQQIAEAYDFSSIIGSSRPLRDALEKVRAVADVGATVLIHGESGSGKELFARAIHYNGPRRDRPMIVVNCGAIPAELIESELFGHTRGAFTGADRDRRGFFEEADGSTIFLDEIGELPLPMQPKLLRVLQEGEITPVGATKPISINVRVVAATNRNLLDEVREGNFREDLFYRLNVISVTVPTLRERREDIPVLAMYFLKRFAEQHGRPAREMSSSAIEALKEHRWPGNVRELANVIEQAVILSRRETIGEEDLRLTGNSQRLATQREADRITVPDGDLTLKEITADVVAQVERRKISEALVAVNSNRTQAARRLGISLRSLMYKLKDLDIS